MNEIEGGHWYKPDGSPFYTVISKSGNERSVTLRDAKKINAVPSVTTVLNILSKPALENWKIKQGILAALTLTRDPEESDDEFLARVLKDSKRQAEDAAAEGTRIHDAIECYFKGGNVPPQYFPHVRSVLDEITNLYPDIDDWRAEDSFAHVSGFGGKVDLHSPSTGIVIDFKTKDGTADTWNKLAYDQYIQLAAYNYGLELPQAECVNIFVSRSTEGGCKSHTWSTEEINKGKEIFITSLQLWQTIKGYRPVWG